MPLWASALLASSVLFLAFLFVSPPTVHAATCTFASNGGATEQDFNTAANWSCSRVPEGGDDVVVPTATSTRLSASAAVKSVTVAGTGSLELLAFNLQATTTFVMSGAGFVTSTSGQFSVSSTSAVAALGTVSSTSGLLVFGGDVTNDGTIQTSLGGIIFYSGLTNTLTGLLNIGAGNATTTNDFSNAGTINGSLGFFHVSGTWTNTGLFLPGAGTVRYTGATQVILSTVYNNLTVNGSGTSTFSGATTTAVGNLLIASGNLSLGSNALHVAGNWTDTGTLVGGTGTVDFTGSSAQTINAEPNFYDVTLTKITGTATLGGDVTSTHVLTITAGTLALGANMLTLSGTGTAGSRPFVATGTFVPNTGTVRYTGGASTDIQVAVYKNLTFNGAGPFNVTASTTAVGNVTITTGTLSTGSNTLHVAGNWTDGGTLSAGTGTIDFTGGSAQTINAEPAFYNLTINKSAGTATLGGNVTSTNVFTITAGGFALSSYTLELTGSGTPFVFTAGTFAPGTGTVRYMGTGAQDVTAAVYNNLFIGTLGGSATLLASSTAVGTLTMASSTFDIGSLDLTVVGLITNDGLIVEGAGASIIHTAELDEFTDSSGTLATSYTTPAVVYVRVQDSNRNLNGKAIETMTVPVTVNSAGGSDSQTMTLTETAVNSGIFASAGINLVNSATVSVDNGQLELTASGVGTATYTDSQDSADVATGTATFTHAAASATPSTGGGGGGGGSVLTFPQQFPLTSTPAASPAPTPVSSSTPSPIPPTSAPTGPVIFTDPSDFNGLATAFGFVANTTGYAIARAQVLADAKEFGLTLTEAQLRGMANFVTYGISRETIKLGSGERRAVLRDYMETVHRADVSWADVQRITIGQIPVSRNLTLERARVSTVLKTFRTMFGHDPNFKNAAENLGWNVLMYRIRFTRDLKREAVGITLFRSLFGRTPTTPSAWAAVRVLAYVK